MERVDKAAAKAALLAVTNKLRAKKPNKSAETRQLRAERRRQLVEEIVHQLTVGETGSSQKFNYRFALQRAVTALKNGATPAQLRACPKLQEAADWSELVEPLRAFAVAKRLPPADLFDSLIAISRKGVGAATVSNAATTAPKGRRK